MVYVLVWDTGREYDKCESNQRLGNTHALTEGECSALVEGLLWIELAGALSRCLGGKDGAELTRWRESSVKS